jgi:dolichol-phosphate mannosyltransferase
MESVNADIKKIRGPVLVLGASGFIGANLFKMIFRERDDVYGTIFRPPAWRLGHRYEKNLLSSDLLVVSNLYEVLNRVRPNTVFNCVAYGAYSFEREYDLIYRTNFSFLVGLTEILQKSNISCFVNAGSSSEYGDNSCKPDEDCLLIPNSHYSVSKLAASKHIHYLGQKLSFPCANLRLYSVYGPLEDASRLVPCMVSEGLNNRYPSLVDPSVSRDFVYIDDSCEAFIKCAINLTERDYGCSFNIGTGVKTTIKDIVYLAKEIFGIDTDPTFSNMEKREWDVLDWQANPERAKKDIKWEPKTTLKDGLHKTINWYKGIENKELYKKRSRIFGLNYEFSISVIVACYNDEKAIPLMYKKLIQLFNKLGIDYEIIFVNDDSPDNSEEVIKDISRKDRNVIGITHTRNFGSQSAFRSGMEIATKNACVIMDGDLQDPPELIEQFWKKWQDGYDVVFGRRVNRDASLPMRFAYKLFYRVFDCFSYLKIPHDAGDFSLMDKKVVNRILSFPERDMFLRGVRAFVGYKQAGIDYVRPKRVFGKTTNSLFKNIGWAKKGILSFSNTPLNILSFSGSVFLLITIILSTIQLVGKLMYPESTPRGITTMLLVIAFFGSINLFALALIGEYIAKIFEEVKERPYFIRQNIIKDGEIHDAGETPGMKETLK